MRGPVSSPTFVLARTHPSLVGGPPLVHVDAYRLGSAAELDDLDLDFERSVVVVEWGAGMVDGIADSVLEVRIARRDDDSRDGGACVRPRWADRARTGVASTLAVSRPGRVVGRRLVAEAAEQQLLPGRQASVRRSRTAARRARRRCTARSGWRRAATVSPSATV